MDVRRPRTVVRHQSVNRVARRNSRVSVVSGDFVSLQRVPKPTDPSHFWNGDFGETVGGAEKSDLL